MYIKTTLETLAILLLLPFTVSPSLLFIISIYHCLPMQPLYFLFLSLSPLSIYHALVSCYSLTLSPPLPPLRYFILPFSIITSTPAIIEITTLFSFLLNHSSYIFFSFSLSLHLPSPPSTPGYVSCLHHPRHHPHHLPHRAGGTVFVCVGCTVLYKSCMLMQQKAAEHYGEWTNFRSAWPRFITAHKPKVRYVR